MADDDEMPVNLSWSRDGKFLAVSGNKAVVVLKRDDGWSTVELEDGSHTDVTCCVAFSPSGLYLASSSVAKVCACLRW